MTDTHSPVEQLVSSSHFDCENAGSNPAGVAHKTRRYSPADLNTLVGMYNAYYSFAQISAALGRSQESIGQQVRRQALKRDHRVVRLLAFHGRHILNAGLEYEQVKETLRACQEADRLKKLRAKALRQIEAIDQLQKEINSGSLTKFTRKFAIRRAHAAGASMKQIGLFTNMTKQAVSQALKS